MYGIPGILTFATHKPSERAKLAAMIALTSPRPRRGEDVNCDGAIGLAHARLSIVALVSGEQPPNYDEDATVQVVFNDEIFDLFELPKESITAVALLISTYLPLTGGAAALNSRKMSPS